MSDSKGRRILKAIAVWAPTILFALFFSFVGVVKFTRSAMWSERLTDWGYPAGANMIIGAVEILAQDRWHPAHIEPQLQGRSREISR